MYGAMRGALTLPVMTNAAARASAGPLFHRPAPGLACAAKRFATKKAGGSSRNGRDSPGQRLGVKKFGGMSVVPGNIIIRQRGTKYRPGANVGIGRDHTIYAVAEGHVSFHYNQKRKRQVVSVVVPPPATTPATPAARQ